MRALLSTTPGGPETLELADIDYPTAGQGEVVLGIRAVGLNFPDVLKIEDKYQVKGKRPFSPGSEVSGVIEAVGPGVMHLKVGDRVMALCGFGGMQEALAIPAANCVKIPTSMSFDEASTLTLSYSAAHYAIAIRARAKPGEKIFILGAAGGFGTAAIEIAKALDLHVIAADLTDAKAEFCLAKGADEAFSYPESPLDKKAQKAFSQKIKSISGGVNIVLDIVGGDYSEPALRSLNWNGRFMVIGFPAGIATMPLNLTLLKSVDIRGVFWGAWQQDHSADAKQQMVTLLELYASGKIRPNIARVFPLEQGGKAIQLLADKEVMGKVVVEVS